MSSAGSVLTDTTHYMRNVLCCQVPKTEKTSRTCDVWNVFLKQSQGIKKSISLDFCVISSILVYNGMCY